MIEAPSPNFGERRDGAVPALIVLHYTAMADAERAVAWLRNPEAEVSAHYLISRGGQVYRLVPEAQRAWHAGAGSWRGAGDVNSRSIGIELDNSGYEPFSEPLMTSLEYLLPGIMERWQIPPESVIGHSDMAPGRKIDPGCRFDWQRLARQGLAVWPGPDMGIKAVDARRFGDALDAIGYPACDFETRLSAFRLRFRPFADGPLTGHDMGVAVEMAHRFGVDAGTGNT